LEEKYKGMSDGEYLGNKYTQKERDNICSAVTIQLEINRTEKWYLTTAKDYPRIKGVVGSPNHQKTLASNNYTDFIIHNTGNNPNMIIVGKDFERCVSKFDPVFNGNRKRMDQLLIDILIYELNINQNRSINEIFHNLIHNDSGTLDFKGRQLLNEKRIELELGLFSTRYREIIKLEKIKLDKINGLLTNIDSSNDKLLINELYGKYNITYSNKEIAFKILNTERAFNNKVYDLKRLLSKEDLRYIKSYILSKKNGQVIFDELVEKSDTVNMKSLLPKFSQELSQLKNLDDYSLLLEKQSLELKEKLYNFSIEELKAKRKEYEKLSNNNPNYLEQKIAEHRARKPS
jgi:hypothetical protein